MTTHDPNELPAPGEPTSGAPTGEPSRLRVPSTRADFAVLGVLAGVLALTLWWARDALVALVEHWYLALALGGLVGLKAARFASTTRDGRDGEPARTPRS